MRLEHKLAIIAGNVVAPGFAQAVAGRRWAMWIWLALGVVPVLLATVSVWFPILAFLVRVAAIFGAILELGRVAGKPVWRRGPASVFAAGIASLLLLQASVEGFSITSASMYPTIEIGDRILIEKLSIRWRAPERGELIVFAYPCSPDADFVKRVVALAGDTVEVRCNVLYVNGTAVPSELVAARSSYDDLNAANEWSKSPASLYRETHGGHTYNVLHDAARPAREQNRDALTAGDARDFPRLDFLFAPGCHQSEFFDKPRGAPQGAGKIVVTKPQASACEQQAHFVVPAGNVFVMGDNRNYGNDSRYWGVVSLDAVAGRVIGVWINHPPGRGRKWSRVGAVH